MDPFSVEKRYRTIRGPVNEYDKSTVVSIFPREITENKPTIQPGTFTIPAGTMEKPGILIVGSSSWWREVDENQPLLEIPVSSVQIADALVKDFCSGLLGCNMTDRMPGIFYVPGEKTAAEIKKEFPQFLIKALATQKNWYLELVRVADILWARSNGNPLAVSDDARLACRELGIKDKPWLKDSQSAELAHCTACGSLRNPAFPVCPVCHAVSDPELAKKLNIQFTTP